MFEDFCVREATSRLYSSVQYHDGTNMSVKFHSLPAEKGRKASLTVTLSPMSPQPKSQKIFLTRLLGLKKKKNTWFMSSTPIIGRQCHHLVNLNQPSQSERKKSKVLCQKFTNRKSNWPILVWGNLKVKKFWLLLQYAQIKSLFLKCHSQQQQPREKVVFFQLLVIVIYSRKTQNWSLMRARDGLLLLFHALFSLSLMLNFQCFFYSARHFGARKEEKRSFSQCCSLTQ